MEYSLHQVCELSGLSARTLRYYDEIGLLKPSRVDISRYRYYDSRSLDRLQTILFYRALDVPLSTIRTLISQPNFDKAAALTCHLTRLIAKKQQLETLIQTIQNTLSALKGEKHMQDSEKFEGFKQHLSTKTKPTTARKFVHATAMPPWMIPTALFNRSAGKNIKAHRTCKRSWQIF